MVTGNAWEEAAALAGTRHRLVMALLDRQSAARAGASPREVYRAVDEINRMVDAVDKGDVAEISRVQDLLNGRLAQLQRASLIERISVIRTTES
jgi:hypothetical protein